MVCCLQALKKNGPDERVHNHSFLSCGISEMVVLCHEKAPLLVRQVDKKRFSPFDTGADLLFCHRNTPLLVAPEEKSSCDAKRHPFFCCVKRSLLVAHEELLFYYKKRCLTV